jgi:hypothetical protein
MRAPVTRRRRLYAVLSWFGCFVGFAVAFDSAVLAIDVGPVSVAVGAVIAATVAIGVANGVAFWRYSNALGRRPLLAAFVLLVAIGWAALGAAVIHQLFGAFNSAR